MVCLASVVCVEAFRYRSCEFLNALYAIKEVPMVNTNILRGVFLGVSGKLLGVFGLLLRGYRNVQSFSCHTVFALVPTNVIRWAVILCEEAQCTWNIFIFY